MLELKGYKGVVLRVNLTKGEVKKEELKEDIAKAFIGGVGLCAYYMFNEVPKGADPLGPENKIMFAGGPVTGTLWPTSGRGVVVSKSPLTGIWGESHFGGHFVPEVKFAGYDAIIIEGRSKKPVYLLIDDENVELKRADHLWGKDVHEATSALLEDEGYEYEVACIGPAGENLVRYACVMFNKNRAAGRTGMGAVMGSKKLKAILVHGSGGVEVAREEELWEKAKEVHERIVNHPQIYDGLYKYGTAMLVEAKMLIGELPTKNHQTGVFEYAEEIGGHALREEFYVKSKGCFGCPVACGKIYRVRRGKYAGAITSGMEYEAVMAFGSNCYNRDAASLIVLNDLCNKYGMDVISAGCTIAWAMECYEKGLITKEDTGGIELKWGDTEVILKLLKK